MLITVLLLILAALLVLAFALRTSGKAPSRRPKSGGEAADNDSNDNPDGLRAE